ncbi:MAG: penicillin-binding transpeptidase domain-containing protein [Anaerolineae bacterium]
MSGSLQRIGRGFLAAFLVIALGLGYWGIVQRERLLIREDNPRRVLEEQRIKRGMIVDRQGVVLAETVESAETGLQVRRYPYPSAAPVVGYYSITYGVGGIEAAQDAFLRGESLVPLSQRRINELLNRPQQGGDVQLTLDLRVQQAVDTALQGWQGAAVLVSVPDGAILAMSSQPTYDPNRLDSTWDQLRSSPAAPLVNRATQGLYQPGVILQSVLLGAALNNGSIDISTAWTGPLSAEINAMRLPCAGDARLYVRTLADAFEWGCPAPFQAVAEALGAEQIDRALADFGLLAPPQIELTTGSAELKSPEAVTDLAMTALGQSTLTVSPLHMVQVAAAFANNGQIPPLHLLLATREPGREWQPVPPPVTPRGTISRSAANTVAVLMANAVEDGGAQAAAIPGYTVHGHSGVAISGPEEQINAWFIGFVTGPDGQTYAAAVLVENAGDAAVAARIGRAGLLAALEASP